MQKLFFSFCIFITAGIFAQDLIILKDGNIIEAKVIEISPTEIRYKRFNHLDGPTIVVPSENVLSIRYENGMTEIINDNIQPLAETTTETNAAQHIDAHLLAETAGVQPAVVQPLIEAAPIPVSIPTITQPEVKPAFNPKLNTLGVSLGYLGISGFGLSANGTASPVPYTFFGFNIDFGFMPFSFNGNANFNGFVPFNKGGWYIRLGLGGGVYEAAEEMYGFFDINAVTGFIFLDWLNISFTLQMELVPEFNINVKPMIGYIYRFSPPAEPAQPAKKAEQLSTLLPQRTEPEVKPAFIRINGGTFNTIIPQRKSVPIQREVTVSSFYISKYEVTQKEYKEVMGANPSKFTGDDLPVERVSWFDAIEYCNRRSINEGLTPVYTINNINGNITVVWNRNANGYRLPTEAEWEYACRAGTTTAFNTGETINTNLANIAGENGIRMTTNVGSYAPNPLGLHDMHGNVWEWCWDWYGNYKNTEETDPIGAASGSGRILRGGSWDNISGSAYRSSRNPLFRNNQTGFRMVRN